MTALLLAALAIGAGLEVEARVEPAEVAVGDTLRLVVLARHAPGGIALLPAALELPEAVAERRDARHHRRETSGGVELDRYELELVALDAGDLVLPAIPLALGATVASTPSLPVKIKSVLSPDEQAVAASTIAAAIPELERAVAENPPPVAIGVLNRPLLAAVGGILGLVLFGLFARRLLRRRAPEAARVAPAPPPRPAHEVARERLEALRAAGLFTRGEKKAFYVELSEILRGYAGARYGFESLELTVPELVLELSTRRTPGLDLERLLEVLNRADLVKFAKFEPSEAEAQRHLNLAFDVVEATAPKEAAA